MSVPNKLLRRVITAVAASSLVVGLLPAMAVAATPESRDLSRFACPSNEVPDPGFTDDDDTVHQAAIACIVWYELASGVSATRYGPDQDVRRDQMATFLANLLTAADVTLPRSPEDAFDDDEDSVHELAINQLAALGIVSGTGSNRYSPSRAVQRDQMATFLNNAYAEISGTALTSSEDYFTDDEDSVHEDNINAVAGAGIAAGKTSVKYDPTLPVLRDQMASFLGRETDLLVEEGQVQKPVVLPAEIRLDSTSVRQGGKVTGKVISQEDVQVTGASVSGCGLTERALTLTGAENTFEFTIPVTQPQGDCDLTFTITRQEGDDITQTVRIDVNAADRTVTAAPELVDVMDVSPSAATNVTLRYRFDEALNTSVKPLVDSFRLYDENADANLDPDFDRKATYASNGTAVDVTFSAKDFASATTATVTAFAVEDGQGVANPEGAFALARGTRTVTGTEGPDLLSVEVGGTAGQVVTYRFTFDESITTHPGDETNYHLVYDDGGAETGTGSSGETGDAEVSVDFPLDTNRTVVRAYVDAEAVSDTGQDSSTVGLDGNLNPTQAVLIGVAKANEKRNEGDLGDSPYLTGVSIDQADNQVSYTFNRSVTLIDKTLAHPDVFIAYDLDGNQVGTKNATVSGGTVTATFSGTADPITADTVGVSVATDAVRAATGSRLPNQVDELRLREGTDVSPAPGGSTAAPDLQSVVRSIEGNDSVLTFTFDAEVSRVLTSDRGSLAIYQQNGSRTTLDLNEVSGNECTASDNVVTCSASSTSALGQLIDSAVLGAVEADTVSSGGTADRRNYEASAAIA